MKVNVVKDPRSQAKAGDLVTSDYHGKNHFFIYNGSAQMTSLSNGGTVSCDPRHLHVFGGELTISNEDLKP